MSLNDIKMPPQLVVGLFPDTLVETEITIIERQLEPAQTVEGQPIIGHSVMEQTVEEEPVAVSLSIQQPVEQQPSMEQTVVEEPEAVPLTTEEPSTKPQFDFQGKNKKHILILFTSDKASYLPEPELKFLVSVLKACALTTEDVAIMNLKHQTAAYKDCQSFFQNRVALLFGLEPEHIDLPMNFPQFQLQNFDQCTYLHAPALSEIEKEKGLKMKLWGCLKNLFSL